MGFISQIATQRDEADQIPHTKEGAGHQRADQQLWAERQPSLSGLVGSILSSSDLLLRQFSHSRPAGLDSVHALDPEFLHHTGRSTDGGDWGQNRQVDQDLSNQTEEEERKLSAIEIKEQRYRWAGERCRTAGEGVFNSG